MIEKRKSIDWLLSVGVWSYPISKNYQDYIWVYVQPYTFLTENKIPALVFVVLSLVQNILINKSEHYLSWILHPTSEKIGDTEG